MSRSFNGYEEPPVISGRVGMLGVLLTLAVMCGVANVANKSHAESQVPISKTATQR